MAPLLAALVAAAALAGVAADTSCSVTLEGVQYDLSPLSRPSNAPYTIQDSRDPSTNYTFNVCADVEAAVLPEEPEWTFLPARTSVPAYQLQESAKTVYELSQPAGQGWNFTLYDDEFKARGVVLGYSGGSTRWCEFAGDGSGRTDRELRLALECDPTAVLNVFDTETVVETQNCKYEVYLASIYACPVACWTQGSNPTSICSGHGVCGYNAAQEAVQCYCNEGYSGSKCGDRVKHPAEGLSVEGVFLIIACIMLAAVMGMILYMINRLRKLRVDPTAFQGLSGQFNELGQLAG